MVLICKDCGNHRKFQREDETSQTDFVYLDEDGEETDRDYGDSETTNTGDVKCYDCESTDVTDLIQEQLEIFIDKHTDIKGNWHEEEIIKLIQEHKGEKYV